MKIAIMKERRAQEKRVAATPETVREFIGLGFNVAVEAGAGVASRIADEDYCAAGAALEADPKALLQDADIVLKVQRPLLANEVVAGDGDLDELALFKRGSLLLASLAPYANTAAVYAYAAADVTAVALEFLPSTTRAQAMDVHSSQSSLAGYRAVLEAAHIFARTIPMTMTAVGTIAPAKVMVLGADVAGLQAIATARRLGAIVCATDECAASKESVESLGATFVMIDKDESANVDIAGDGAKELSERYKRRQVQLVAETMQEQDIVIATAQIHGRCAPVLITADMVRSMRPGSVIVDLAAEQGGNCELTNPGEIVEIDGVTIIGLGNLPSRLATDASALYAKNLLNYLTSQVQEGQLAINWQDEVIASSVLTHAGKIVHPVFKSKQG